LCPGDHSYHGESQNQKHQQNWRVRGKRFKLTTPVAVGMDARFVTDSDRLQPVRKRVYRIRLSEGEQLCLCGKYSVTIAGAQCPLQQRLFFNSAETALSIWQDPVPVDAPAWQSAPVWRVQQGQLVLLITDRSRGSYPWPIRLSAPAENSQHLTPKSLVARYTAPPLHFSGLENLVAALAGEQAPVVLVAGPRHTGKSTLVSQLSFMGWPYHPQPLILELDLGQNYFLAPGYVSFHEVRDLAWPIWRASTACLESVFCGNVTPFADPALYRQAVQRLWSACEAWRGKRLVLVNTMGWVRGYGEVLLGSVLDTIRPDLIVWVSEGTDAQHAGGEAEIEAFGTTAGSRVQVLHVQRAPSSAHKQRSLLPAVARASQLIHELVQQCEDGLPRGIIADQFRWFLWQNQPAYPIVQLLCSITPWCVPLEFFAAVFMIEPCGMHRLQPGHDSERLYSMLNASVVALCVTVIDKEEPTEEISLQAPQRWLLRSPGLGLVRSIDPQNGLLYIVTSVPLSVLESTVALAMSPEVQLPAAALQLGGMEAEPFLGLGCTGTAEDTASDAVVTSRKNLLRRRLMKAKVSPS